jgi:hypothetical protein
VDRGLKLGRSACFSAHTAYAQLAGKRSKGGPHVAVGARVCGRSDPNRGPFGITANMSQRSGGVEITEVQAKGNPEPGPQWAYRRDSSFDVGWLTILLP